MQVEIIDPQGNVSYRRPHDHPDVMEALSTPGYSVRGAEPKGEPQVRISAGLDDAIACLNRLAKEYSKLCDAMLTMPERPSELKAGMRIMDAMESLRDKLLKRKSSNDPDQRPGELPKTL